MTKLQSGIAGEIEPLRRIGYALDAATLQQTAYNHGIEMNINNMSQAQKAQLRYITIMEQSKNVMGDMARTIESPANQIRILQSRIETLKRTIGDSLLPVLSAVLPYVTAFVKILGETFRKIADFMGFEIPEFDYSKSVVSGNEDITSSNEDIASSFDDATDSAKKFKGSLSAIDQLNIIGSKSDGSSGSGLGGGGQYGNDLDVSLPSYDFLGGLEEETSKAYEQLKDFLDKIGPVVKGILTTLGALWLGDKVLKIAKGLKDAFDLLSKTQFGKFASALAGGVTSFFLFKKAVKDVVTGKDGGIWELVGSLSAAAGAAALFVMSGNPLGAILVGIGAAIGAIVGYNEGLRELDNALADSITFADTGGISIDRLASGYETYFDKITDGYDDIINNNNALKDQCKKMDEAATNIENLTDKYRDLNSTMTGEDAQTIKDNIKEIGELARDYLGKATADLIDTLTDKFEKFAEKLGVQVDKISGKLRLLQGMGESKIEELQQQAVDLVDSLSSGALTSEEFQKALNDLDDVTQKLSVPNVTVESTSFTKALQEMTSASVKMSPDEALSSIEELNKKANEAKSKINEAWEGQLATLANTKDYYKKLGIDVEFDAQMKANGVDTTFDDVFSDMEKVIDNGYQNELKKIDTGQAIFLEQVQSQLNTNARKYAEGKFREKGAGVGSTISWFMNDGGLLADGADLYTRAISDYEEEYFKTENPQKLQEAINEGLSGLDVSGSEDIGKFIIEGMKNGTINNLDDFTKALDTAAEGGLEELRKVFETHSPSKKTEEIGEYLMQGLTIGIESGEQNVLDTIDKIAQHINERMGKINTQMPTYTDEDIDNMTSGAFTGAKIGLFAAQSPKYENADPQAISNAGKALSEGGTPINVNVNLQSYVDLDGEQVGEAIAQYQQRQMAYSNGK